MRPAKVFNRRRIYACCGVFLAGAALFGLVSACTSSNVTKPTPTPPAPRIYSISPSSVKGGEPTVFTVEGQYFTNLDYPGAIALWFYPSLDTIPLQMITGNILTTKPVDLPSGQYKVMVGFPQSNDNITVSIQ